MVTNRDNYYQIDVAWTGGFKHKIYCRGYNLKSMLNFQESIFWIDKFTYKEITEQQYKKGTQYNDNSDTSKEKSVSGRKQSGTSNGKRNYPGGDDKQPRVKARNSTGSGTRRNPSKSGGRNSTRVGKSTSHKD